MNTPWGSSQHQKKLQEGVYEVSTAGHGGIMVDAKIAIDILTPQARAHGMKHGPWLCYEEDCQWAIPAYELNIGDKNEAWKTISAWDADYLIERGIEPEPKMYARYNEMKMESKMRSEKHPDLIISASGDWKEGVPKGGVEVITADGSRYIVTNKSYQARSERSGLNLLSLCELWPEKQDV